MVDGLGWMGWIRDRMEWNGSGTNFEVEIEIEIDGEIGLHCIGLNWGFWLVIGNMTLTATVGDMKGTCGKWQVVCRKGKVSDTLDERCALCLGKKGRRLGSCWTATGK